jgi:hypothetical protein
MTTNEQGLYGSFHQSLLFMLGEIQTKVEDMVNPEDATYGDLADLTRLQSVIADAYNAFINN